MLKLQLPDRFFGILFEFSSWKFPMSERPREMRMPSQRLILFHSISSLKDQFSKYFFVLENISTLQSWDIYYNFVILVLFVLLILTFRGRFHNKITLLAQPLRCFRANGEKWRLAKRSSFGDKQSWKAIHCEFVYAIGPLTTNIPKAR
jgi:hypothetical protein